MFMLLSNLCLTLVAVCFISLCSMFFTNVMRWWQSKTGVFFYALLLHYFAVVVFGGLALLFASLSNPITKGKTGKAQYICLELSKSNECISWAKVYQEK